MASWKRLSFTVAAALLLAPSTAMAGALEDGIADYTFSDFANAQKLLLPLANQGNADAQLYIGLMYDNGQGVTKNPATALTWYRKAGAQGNIRALALTGEAYFYGDGVKQDYAQAAKLLLKPAQLGDADAQDSLGWLYETGNGVTQDTDQGCSWFLRSANQRNTGAMEHMADSYIPESNEPEIYFWYSLLARTNSNYAKYRDDEAKIITPDQKAAVDARLAQWKPVPEKH